MATTKSLSPRYEALCMTSGNALWEEFQLSNPGKMFLFIFF